MSEAWRRCSACKQDIPVSGTYYSCSVSTCNRKRTALVFCSVSCWEVHLPTERHREAWAVEQRAPATPEPVAQATERAARKGAPTPKGSSNEKPGVKAAAPPRQGTRGEILVVASRLKAYVRAESGFSTSDAVLPLLSDAIRKICDEAIEAARRAERLTVMDRDVPRN